jgi:hypothetical protein
LRQRYYQSTFTRDAIATSDSKISAYMHQDGTSPVLVQIWEKGRMLVVRWAGSTLAPQEPPARR